MAVAFLQEFSPTGDRSTTNYDTINERLGADQDPPEGVIFHSVGFGEDGTFRIYDVWESREHLDRFLNERLMPLHLALFTETSPAPVKYAASLLGLCTAEVRLPLCEIQEATKAKVHEAMVSAGLLSD